MRQLTRSDYELVDKVVFPIVERYGLEGCETDMGNPFLFLFYVSEGNAEAKVVAAANEIGEGSDYCYVADSENGDYMLAFNHPVAMSFKDGDEEYQYTIKYDSEQQEAEALAWEAETLALVDGIKKGRLKVKSPDGYLVLAGEFYDAIESGEKTIEYRDFTKYNINRMIGLKTVRFNHGYGSKGKPPKQMQWEVKGVVLMDGDENECDPYNVPEDFWPVTIALKLGKRIG